MSVVFEVEVTGVVVPTPLGRAVVPLVVGSVTVEPQSCPRHACCKAGTLVVTPFGLVLTREEWNSWDYD